MGEDLELITGLYAAAADSSLWPDALAGLVNAFDGVAADLWIDNDGTAVFAQQFGGHDQMWRDYFAHYYHLSPRVRGLPTLAVGDIVTDTHFLRPAEMQRNAFYADFLWRYRFGYMIGGAVGRRGSDAAYLGIHLPKDMGHPNDAQCRRLRRLWPHLQRVVAVQERLLQVSGTAALLRSGYDLLDVGVVIIDRHRLIRHQNAYADRLVAESDGICARQGRLVAVGSCNGDDLLQSIRTATSPIAGGDAPPGGVLTVDRGPLRSSLTVVILPLPEQTVGTSGHAIVFISDPEHTPTDRRRLLRAIFGFTAREAELALAITAGQSAETYAADHDVSITTVRTQLRAILSKCGVHSQSQAIARMMRVVPSVSPANR